ncbi:MAG: hypothetical protein HKM95_07800 [Inquilinus sp.]|nr:hypothetical protein [Inquilinus sp.]
MAVGTWQDPDHETQTGTTLKTNYDNAHAVAKRIVDGFAPHEAAPADLTVVVDAGAIWDGTTLTELAPQTTPAIALPATDERISRVVRDRATGAISVVDGADAPAPVPPAILAGQEPVARIGPLTPATPAITNALIADERAGLTPQPVPDPAAGPAFGLLRRNAAGAYEIMTPGSASTLKNVIENPSFFLAWMQPSTNPGQVFDGDYLFNRWMVLNSDAGDIWCTKSGNFYDSYGQFERGAAGGRFGIAQYVNVFYGRRLFGAGSLSLSFEARSNAGVANLRVYLVDKGFGVPDLENIVSSWNAAGADPTFGSGWSVQWSSGNIPVTWLTTRFVFENIRYFSGDFALLIITDDDAVALDGGFDIRNVMIEPGSRATDWNPRDLHEEQRRCLRYAVRIPGPALIGHVATSTSVRVSAILPIELADFTTVTLLNGAMRYQNTSVSPSSPTISPTQTQIQSLGLTALSFVITGYAGLAVGQGVEGSQATGAILLTTDLG